MSEIEVRLEIAKMAQLPSSISGDNLEAAMKMSGFQDRFDRIAAKVFGKESTEQAATADTIQAGDVVRLKSGGPDMVVSHEFVEHDSPSVQRQMLRCVWMTGDKKNVEAFTVACLEKVAKQFDSRISIGFDPVSEGENPHYTTADYVREIWEMTKKANEPVGGSICIEGAGGVKLMGWVEREPNRRNKG